MAQTGRVPAESRSRWWGDTSPSEETSKSARQRLMALVHRRHRPSPMNSDEAPSGAHVVESSSESSITIVNSDGGKASNSGRHHHFPLGRDTSSLRNKRCSISLTLAAIDLEKIGFSFVRIKIRATSNLERSAVSSSSSTTSPNVDNKVWKCYASHISRGTPFESLIGPLAIC